jgi:hypothetical protein
MDMHFRAILPAIGLIASITAPAVAKDLTFLEHYDADALVLFECAELASEVRVNYLKSGFDAYAEVVTKYRAAGKAAVIKSALLIDEDKDRPISVRPSFQSKAVERKVASDVATHATVAKQMLVARAHETCRRAGFLAGERRRSTGSSQVTTTGLA